MRDATIRDSTSISWESVPKTSCTWVDLLIFIARLFRVMYLSWCDFRQLIRSSSVSASARSFVRSPPTMQPFYQGYHWWPWDKATLFPMEKSKITETEKGETGEEQSQEHAHRFLWLQCDCSQRVRPGMPNSQFRLLLWCLTATMWKCAKTSPRTLVTKELAVGSRQRTSLHFLFHQGIFFFTKNNITVTPTHPTCVAWPPATCLCIPKWRWDWKAAILTQWGDRGRIAGGTELAHRTQLPGYVKKNGRSTGNGAYVRKETTLMVKVTIRLKGGFWPDGSTSPRNYGCVWYTPSPPHIFKA
jgi:hypothetical protein